MNVLHIMSNAIFSWNNIVCEERAAQGPARNYRQYTGLNLSLEMPPLTWSPSHIEKGEQCLFSENPHRNSKPGTRAWQAPRPLLYNIVGKVC